VTVTLPELSAAIRHATRRADPDLDPDVIRIGVTGHVRLTARSSRLIGAALRAALRWEHRPVHGITCLAPGADQLFAEALIAENRTYDVVLPAPDYREREIPPANRRAFDLLLRRARRVSHAFFATGELAYEAAGLSMLDASDRLIAVWNGRETGGVVGGTAEIVAAARRRGIPVERVWPAGADRE
jgi:hypothetical protein